MSASQLPDQVPSTDATLVNYKRVTRELFHQLLSTFQGMLPPEKANQFAQVGEELKSSILERLDAIAQTSVARDTRRNRFLLRLVLSRVSPLFSGKAAIMPRSLIEGLDSYLIKAFGPIIYEELNNEADQILWHLAVGDDQQLWEAINKSPSMRRFVDTIFIRILFRFENFASGKKTFMSIVDRTMQDRSNFSFTEEHFFAVFEAMFSDLWIEGQNEGQRIRWDFLFGDGSSTRLLDILRQGLARWLRRRAGGTILATGRAAAARREDAPR